MAISSMKETRRKDDSKRLETISALVKEAGDPRSLSIGMEQQLIDAAVANATGLNAESSRKTFRAECITALNYDVIQHFADILALSERMWRDGKITGHSRYHILMDICRRVAGGRGRYKQSFDEIAKWYDEHGSLLP